MPLDANQQAQLKTIATTISAQVAGALSKLLNTQVTMSFTALEAAKTSGAQASVDAEMVLATSGLEEVSFGNISILTSTQNAVIIGNLMAGSSEDGGDLGSDQSEAFASALSQSFTDALTHIAELQDSGFTLKGFNVRVLDPADPASLKIEDAEQEKSALIFSLKTASGLNSSIEVDLTIDLINALLMSFPVTAAKQSVDSGAGANTVGDILGADFGQIIDSHNPEDIDEKKNLNLLMDIRLGLIVELGRAEMHLKDILKLTKGSIIELDRLSGESVDLFVNNKLIARGEVVVIDDNFGLRITQLAGVNSAAEMALLMSGNG